MSEAELQARIMLAVGALPSVRLFRNNTGSAWQGEVVRQEPGLIVLAQPRCVEFGLCVGSSDLIGHVNGRFLAIEVKTPTGHVSREQSRFIDHINAAGGLAGVVRSTVEARRLLGIAG